jgi:uncharacterized protein
MPHALRQRAAAAPRHDKVEIGYDARKGRGLFARTAMAPGELIEAAPVIVLSAEDCRTLDRTKLGHYYFHWDGDYDGDGRGALALGLIALCNHSGRPKARARRNHATEHLELVALTPIAPGDEITIDYGCSLWFEASE